MKRMSLLMKTFVFIWGFSAAVANVLAAVPTITGFTPGEGMAGTTVTITGTNFNAEPNSNSVYFGVAKAKVTAASATSLTVEVPAGATFAPITVSDITTGLTAFSDKPFIARFTGGTYVSSSSFSNLGTIFTCEGASAKGIQLGDMDNDGRVDIVVVESFDQNASGRVSILRNGGAEGAFSIKSSFNIDAKIDPTNCHIVDYNGDGNLDIFALVKSSFLYSGTMFYFNNQSNGQLIFDSKVEYTTPANPNHMATADFDGDGRIDFIVTFNDTSKTNSSIQIYRTTDANSKIPTAFPQTINSLSECRGIAVGDIDGDKKPDMAIITKYSNEAGSEVAVYRNTSTNGTISFDSPIVVSIPKHATSIAMADMDGDSKQDLIISCDYTNAISGTIKLLLNTSSIGNISFSATDYSYASIVQPTKLVIADIDGTGKPDIIISGDYLNTTNSKISVLGNISTIGVPSFSAENTFLANKAIVSLAVSDLNNDNLPDIALCHNDGTSSYLKNVNTLKPSNFKVSSYSSSSATLSWTRGTGDGVIVVARKGAAVSYTPVRGTSYSGNTVFGNGDALGGTANYVVYKGTGTSATITGLTANTAYHFMIWEYKSANLYETNGVKTNITTQTAAAPSKATAFTTSLITPTSMTVGWARGNGNGVMVVARANSAVDALPTDGTSYTANNVFGSGTEIGSGNFVVYVGSGTSVNITGLHPAVKYYFAIYEKNTGPIFNMSPLTGNVLTSSIYPSIQASYLAAKSIGADYIDLSWTRGNGSSVIIVAKEGTLGDAIPLDGNTVTANAKFGNGTELNSGNYVVYNGTGTSVRVTGLNKNTPYTFEIMEVYDFKCYKQTGVKLTVSTFSCAQPTVQAFDITGSNITNNSMKVGWTRGNGQYVVVLARAGKPVDASLIDGKWIYYPDSKFGAGTKVGDDNFVIYNGGGTFVNVLELSQGTTYYYAVYEYNSSGYCYSLKPLTGEFTTNSTCVPPVVQAKKFTYENISDTEATISWVRGSGNAILVTASEDASDMSPTDGLTYTPSTVYGSGSKIGNKDFVIYKGYGNIVTVTNLKPGYYYDIKLYEVSNDNCYKSPATIGELRSILPEPTPELATTNFLAYNITGSSLTLKWQNNQHDAIIIAREGSPVNAAPLNGNPYPYHNEFGKGADLGNGNFVISRSNYYTYVTGLKPNTKYYFAAFSVTYNNKYSVTSITTDATTLDACLKPTIQASDLNYTFVNNTSMNLTWTRGNGSSVLLVADDEGPIEQNPQEGSNYFCRPYFMSGGYISFNGGYGIYNGTGTSCTISGLKHGTKYNFALYEVSSSYCYHTPGVKLDLTTTSTCVQPSKVAYINDIVLNADNSVNLSWTRGNGAYTMVIGKLGNSPDMAPIDGQTYTPDSIFGNGSQLGSGNYVLYCGTGTSVNIQNIPPGKYLFLRVYEVSATNCYLGNSDDSDIGIPGCSYPTAQATNLTTSTVKSSSMIVSWSRGTGNKVIVIARADGAVNVTPANGSSYIANTEFGKGSQLGAGNYVVYNGTGSYAKITGLTASTAYHFAIYEVSQTNCYKDVPLTGFATTSAPCIQPTTQASSFTSTDIANRSMTIGWTRGTGDYVLVLAKVGNPVDATPEESTMYAASTYFGNGSMIGNGNYVVYSGTGTSVALTGLAKNSAYHYAVFEVSATGCYKLPALSGNAATANVCDYPVLQAGNFKATNLFSNSTYLSWTNGNGTKRIVLAKAGSAVDAAPADGVSYTADNTFGNGSEIGTGNYVVFSGTTNQFIVLGLSPATEYHYAIFEVSADDCYKTPALTCQGTTSEPCVYPTIQASGFSASAIKSTSMTINWTRGNGQSGVLVFVKAHSAITSNPTDGYSYYANPAYGVGSSMNGPAYCVYNGSGTSVNITGLTEGTTYHFAIYEASNVTCHQTPALTGNATTTIPCTPPAIQASSFTANDISANSMKVGWTRGNGSSVIVLAKAGSEVDASPTDGITYTANASFGIGSQIGSNNYVVYSGVGTSFYMSDLNPTTNYYYAVFEVSATNCYKAPALTGSAFTSDICEIPTIQASSFEPVYLGAKTATIKWNRGNGARSLLVAKAGSPVDASLVTGEYICNSVFGLAVSIGNGNYPIYYGTDSVVTITGLSSNTSYYFAVFEASVADCYLEPALTGNLTTLTETDCTEPTEQVSNFVISDVTVNDAKLSWSRGNGAKVIVLAKEGSVVDAMPLNTQNYFGSNSFGLGQEVGNGVYVIYCGNESSININNLNPGTSYYFAVMELSATNCYKTPAITSNLTTLNNCLYPEIQAGSFTASLLSGNSMTIGWARGNGSSVIILAKAGNEVDAIPTDGIAYVANASFGNGAQIGDANFVVYNGTGTSVNIYNLQKGKKYYFSIYEASNDFCYKTPALTGTASTLMTNIESVSNIDALVYPNPVSEKLFIEVNNKSEEIRYEITNAMSVVLIKGTLLDKGEVYTGNLNSGLYILKLINDNKTEYYRVIKK